MMVLMLLVYIIIFTLIIGIANPAFIPTSSPTDIGLHGCKITEHGFYSNVMITCIDRNAKYSDSDNGTPSMLIIAKDLINYDIVDQVLADDDSSIYFNVSINAYPDPIPDSILVQESSSIDYVDKLIGIALDGIPIYTAMLQPGIDALDGESIFRIDYCGGTYGNTPDGVRYHYRTIPACVRVLNNPTAQAIFNNAANKKRKQYIKDIHELLDAFDDLDTGPIVLGYSLTGYPIYSPFDNNGILQNNLDNCNGKFINGKNYAYYVSPTFPYVIGCNGPGIYSVDEEHVTIEALPSTVQGVKYNICPSGSYFDGKTNGCYLCPAGKFATATFSRDAAKGSAFDIRGGTCNQNCPPGHYCPKGAIKPVKCDGGKFGASYGLATRDCSGPCKPGFFCPSASVQPDPFPCGLANFYCPLGTAVRHAVSPGWYSTPENVSDLYRTAQEPCPPGSYCVLGLKYPCPSGTYNPLSNQVKCTSLCPRGFFCQTGSLYPIACPSGKYGNQIGLSNSSCSGLCSPGYWCGDASITATQNRCPSGRYGAEYGLQTEQCSPICETVTTDLELTLDDNRILTPSTNFNFSYGRGFNGTGTLPDMMPIGDSYGIAVDSRPQGGAVVFVADTLSSRVVRIDKNDGNITSYGEHWIMPSAICLDSSTGDVYVSDTWNNTVTRIRADNGQMSRIGFYNVSKKAMYDGKSRSWKKPSGLAFDSANGNLFVADTLNDRIVKISRDNGNLISYGTKFNNGIFNQPMGLAFDSATGNLFVGSFSDKQIYLISANDGPVYTWGPKMPIGINPASFTNDIYPFNTTKVNSAHIRLFGGPQGLAYDSTSATLYFTYYNTLYSMDSNDSVAVVYESDHFYNIWDVDIDTNTKDIFIVSGEGVTKIVYGAPASNANMVSKHVPFCQVRYCSQGYYCPTTSTSPTQVECGGSNFYCPPGTSSPFIVAEGYYSVGSISQPGLMQSDADVNTRSAQIQCEKGYWCSNGVRYRCPKGSYGGDIGMKSSYCSGPCLPGYICDEASSSPTQRACGINDNDASVYCPLGSNVPTLVPAGYYSVGDTLTTKSRIVICEPGYYCYSGIKRTCPAGRYASVTGSTSAACQGICAAGYYCPQNSTSSTQFPLQAGRYGREGEKNPRGTGECKAGYYCPQSSTSPTQFECGGENVYCPPGVGAPIPVSSKFYSTGQNSTIRTDEAYCNNDPYSGVPPAGTKRVNFCPNTMVP